MRRDGQVENRMSVGWLSRGNSLGVEIGRSASLYYASLRQRELYMHDPVRSFIVNEGSVPVGLGYRLVKSTATYCVHRHSIPITSPASRAPPSAGSSSASLDGRWLNASSMNCGPPPPWLWLPPSSSRWCSIQRAPRGFAMTSGAAHGSDRASNRRGSCTCSPPHARVGSARLPEPQAPQAPGRSDVISCHSMHCDEEGVEEDETDQPPLWQGQSTRRRGCSYKMRRQGISHTNDSVSHESE